jgi:hypothetical protein
MIHLSLSVVSMMLPNPQESQTILVALNHEFFEPTDNELLLSNVLVELKGRLVERLMRVEKVVNCIIVNLEI